MGAVAIFLIMAAVGLVGTIFCYLTGAFRNRNYEELY